jgi:hypothetical protein
MDITWFTTPEISKMLDVSGAYLRRITPELMRNQPDAVRKVANKRGKLEWQWSSELVKAQQAKRNKRAQGATPTATKEVQTTQAVAAAIQPIQPQPEPQLSATTQANLSATATNQAQPLELGAHPQEDGTIAQVFTQEEYDQFYKVLSEAVNLKVSHNELKQSHEAHLESYEARITTLAADIAYLRSSLDKQQELTKLLSETHLKSIQGIRERNYIEAQRLQEQNNPTIILPKD